MRKSVEEIPTTVYEHEELEVRNRSLLFEARWCPTSSFSCNKSIIITAPTEVGWIQFTSLSPYSTRFTCTLKSLYELLHRGSIETREFLQLYFTWYVRLVGAFFWFYMGFSRSDQVHLLHAFPPRHVIASKTSPAAAASAASADKARARYPQEPFKEDTVVKVDSNDIIVDLQNPVPLVGVSVVIDEWSGEALPVGEAEAASTAVLLANFPDPTRRPSAV